MQNKEVLEYIKKSFELKNQGFYKPAIEMLYKALALDSENIEILVQLAYLYKLLGNLERAVYYIDKVFEIDNQHIDSMHLLEEIYLIKNDLSSAKEISRKIFDTQPTSENLAKHINTLNKLQDFESVIEIERSIKDLNDDVLYELACAYYTNFDVEKAVELLELASAKNDTNDKVKIFLGKIYYEKNNFEKAKELFLKLEKTSGSPDVFNYLGLLNMNEKNTAKAIEYLSKAQESDEKNSEYNYNLASAYFLNGWFDEALKYFSQAVCFDSENIDYHYSLAYLYYQKKLYDKALYELDFINSIEQHHALSNVLRSMIVAKKGDLFTAKSELEKIVKYNEADDFAFAALCQIYLELSQLDLAKDMIKKAIELNPDSLTYLSDLVEIEIQLKNFDEALEIVDKILKINKNYLFAYIATAKIDWELKNFGKVFDAAQDIIEMDSNSPEGYYYNALALFEQGDTSFAVESLKKSISLDLNNSSLYVKMSEFYQDLGDLKNAYIWAKEASDIDERNYKYKWLCAKLAVSLKDENDAVKYYSLAYRLAPGDKDLSEDYSDYLKSIGKNKQADKILKV